MASFTTASESLCKRRTVSIFPAHVIILSAFGRYAAIPMRYTQMSFSMIIQCDRMTTGVSLSSILWGPRAVIILISQVNRLYRSPDARDPPGSSPVTRCQRRQALGSCHRVGWNSRGGPLQTLLIGQVMRAFQRDFRISDCPVQSFFSPTVVKACWRLGRPSYFVISSQWWLEIAQSISIRGRTSALRGSVPCPERRRLQ